ncbi:hypothetical protein [Leucobacter chromiireducens]|uniref:hypothetical protein n=1 Tax=Leucobacter chromiireducens TaxID=283877 RepID=UPI000F63F8A0|nr:hypothetical protein [Leucobacter chromiireducens]
MSPADPDQEAGRQADALLPPDAAARDAAKREELGPQDDALSGSDITFVTRGVSAEEHAAVIAVLTQVRAEETQSAKRVARRDREPWARSQRVPEGISDLLVEG